MAYDRRQDRGKMGQGDPELYYLADLNILMTKLEKVESENHRN